MRQTLLARLRRSASGDEGVVLAAVLLTAFVLSLLGAALLAYTTQQMPQAAEHQDRQAALAAAEAGIEDYLGRVNRDPEYFTNGFDDGTNPSFHGWVPVPGAQDDTAEYRVDFVDIDAVVSRGVIVVQATGRVGRSERSVRVELTRKKFTDYAYLSDLEVNDPLNRVSYPNTDTPEEIAIVQQACGTYAWAGRVDSEPGRDSCQTMEWKDGDAPDGKLHSNDLLVVEGSPQFNDRVESGCLPPGCGTKSGGVFRNYQHKHGSPTFAYPEANGYGVVAAGIVAFPKSNQALRKQVESPYDGCLFTGPTRVVLKGDHAEVWSRNSRHTNGPGCGGDYTTDPTAKRIVPIPEHGLVMFVQNIPADASDPNHTSTPYSEAPFIPGTKPAKSPSRYIPDPDDPTKTNAVPPGFPLPEDKGYTDLGVYGPSQGDVLVEGQIDGRLTIGAEDDVFITGDLTRKHRTGDLLGLVANNFLWNYHPVNAVSGKNEKYEMCGGLCMHDVRIEASIMSVNHAYGTVYPKVGASQGTITTVGSIVQKWRNSVGDDDFGTSDHTGYAKKYGHDPQLRYTQPPHFLQPESMVWDVSRWAEP